MHEALAKGLIRADGDVVAYINAGDYYHPRAFDIVTDVFEQNSCDWITGCNMFRTYNRKAGLGMKIPPSMDLLS